MRISDWSSDGCSSDLAEVLPQSQRRFSLVERIEVKARSAAFQQRFTETCDHVKAEIEQRRLVVLQHFELEADPARNLGAASGGEAQQLRRVDDRQDRERAV